MEPFKNLINAKTVRKIASLIKGIDPSFNDVNFLTLTDKKLSNYELKQRVNLLSEELHLCFKAEYKKIIKIFVKISKTNISNGLSGFELWPLTHYIEKYGLDHFDESLEVLGELTKDFTSEWAIRPFLIKDLNRSKKYLDKWSNSKCHHQRRLVSEGTRPLLPWGMKLGFIQDKPSLVWDYLEKLKNDESMYVRKSVANHVNDHSKKNSDFVIKKLKDWAKESKDNVELQWIIRHALRTLIKKGDVEALKLIAVNQDVISFSKIKIRKSEIRLGETIEISLELSNKTSIDQLTIVDVEIDLLKKNNAYVSKCFKGKKITLKKNETYKMSIKIPIKEVTTRKYYEGLHFLCLVVNGKKSKKLKFGLKL